MSKLLLIKNKVKKKNFKKNNIQKILDEYTIGIINTTLEFEDTFTYLKLHNSKKILFIGLDKYNISYFLTQKNCILYLDDKIQKVDSEIINILNLIKFSDIIVNSEQLHKQFPNSKVKNIYNNLESEKYFNSRPSYKKNKNFIENPYKKYIIDNKIKEKIIPKFNFYEHFNIPKFNFNKVKKNFYFDTKIIKKIYNLKYCNEIVKYYKEKGIEEGFFINKRQITNFYNCIFEDSLIRYEKNTYTYHNFIEKYFNSVRFENLSNKIIIEKKWKFKHNNFKTIFLIHSSKKEKLNTIINQFKTLKKNNLFLITSTENIDSIYLNALDNYKFYHIKNVGNDLIPSIKILLDSKDIKYDYIFKFHTKGNNIIFNYFLNFFKLNFFRILRILDNNRQFEFSSSNKYIFNFKEDLFNKNILNKIINDQLTKHFCAISFFIGRKQPFLNNIKLLQPLLKPSLINCFYYDNMMFYDNSPVHSIERVISQSSNILNLDNYKYKKFGLNIASHVTSDLSLYILGNNIEKLKNIVVDIYVYYTGNIPENFIKKYNFVRFKESNNNNLDFGKHFDFYKDNITKYEHFILTNDSFLMLENNNAFIDFIMTQNKSFIGYLESKENKPHYQSWMWYLSKKNFVNLKNNFGKEKSHKIELNFTDKVDSKTCYFKAINNCNIFSDNETYKNFYNNFNFRILKKKQIFLVIPKILENKIDKSKLPKISFKLDKVPDDFSIEKYKEYNKDIPNNWDRKTVKKHYLNYGIYEFRKYNDDNIIFINPDVKEILSNHKINFDAFL